MSSYSPSTIARIADIVRGLIVRTSVANNTTALVVAQVSIFNVYGRIRILGLSVEAITAWSNDATTLKFSFDPSTPALSVIDISAASTTVAQLGVGRRVRLNGTALNTALDIDANAAVSLQEVKAIDVGCTDGVGVLTVTGAAAAQTSGTCQFTLRYVPLTEGAYAEASF